MYNRSHNKNVLICYAVYPVKYRRKAITKEAIKTIKIACIEISKRYS